MTLSGTGNIRNDSGLNLTAYRDKKTTPSRRGGFLFIEDKIYQFTLTINTKSSTFLTCWVRANPESDDRFDNFIL